MSTDVPVTVVIRRTVGIGVAHALTYALIHIHTRARTNARTHANAHARTTVRGEGAEMNVNRLFGATPLTVPDVARLVEDGRSGVAHLGRDAERSERANGRSTLSAAVRPCVRHLDGSVGRSAGDEAIGERGTTWWNGLKRRGDGTQRHPTPQVELRGQPGGMDCNALSWLLRLRLRPGWT